MIKFKWEHGPELLCSVDPVTLTTLALAGGVGAGAASMAGGNTPTAPMSAPATPGPQQNPIGTRGGQSASNQQPSFVGASSLPQQSGYGQKTLLGQ
jgi:hypothetical protein